MSNRSRRRSHAAVAALVARFPAAFSRYGSNRRPLKIGIDIDLAGRGVDAPCPADDVQAIVKHYKLVCDAIPDWSIASKERTVIYQRGPDKHARSRARATAA